MTERKFTDEEVIKALEHCTSSTTSEACNGCPFNQSNICEQMSNGLEIYALDLIKRQRARIARLQQGEYRHIGKTLVNARNEAIEDFAERVKKECLVDRGYEILQEGTIDHLVKEMTEDEQ